MKDILLDAWEIHKQIISLYLIELQERGEFNPPIVGDGAAYYVLDLLGSEDLTQFMKNLLDSQEVL